MTNNISSTIDHKFTIKILVGMICGVSVGLLFKWVAIPPYIFKIFINDIFHTLGNMFINLIRMVVVPVVFVSLVCGSASLGDLRKFGRVGGKALALYLTTTMVAVILAIVFALIFKVGDGLNIASSMQFTPPKPISLTHIFTNIIPINPIMSLAQGHMLQIIVFAVLLGLAMTAVGHKANRVVEVFESMNNALMHLIIMIMRLAPYGVFCLLAALFARLGYQAIIELIGYFLVVVLVLLIQLLGTYTILLTVLGRLNPLIFLAKMRAAMLFAFSVSSSNASIPVVLKTVEQKLGVKNTIASFIIPLGSTINMDGTAIMQGVATVFIAHIYHVPLNFMSYLTVIAMATLASIGTAGVPGIGMITLAMVLEQVGIPVQGIALILGVDRLLDMLRTAVNVSGDAMIASIVAKSEKSIDEVVYRDKEVVL